MENKVTTFGGEIVDKSKARKIGGIYYKIGDITDPNAEVVYLNEKYYRTCIGEDSLITYCFNRKRWILNEGIRIIFKEVNGCPVFCINTESVIASKEDGLYTYQPHNYDFYITKEYANKKGFVESILCGKYGSKIEIVKTYNTSNKLAVDNRSFPYNIDLNQAKKIGEYAMSQFQSKDYSNIELETAKFLKNYTFGYEFETAGGYINPEKAKSLGLFPLRDGSIKGVEYVTGILIPNNSYYRFLKQSLFELDKHCYTNSECGIHLNIGNIPQTKEMFVNMYKVFVSFQDSLLNDLVLPYRKDSRFFYEVKKGKDHCKPLPKVDADENFLFRLFSNGKRDCELFGKNVTGGLNKWDIKARYYGFNFTKYIWNTSNLIEFRHLHPTMDFNEVLTFTYVCTALLEYAKNLPSDFQITTLDITKDLLPIISKSYPAIALQIRMTIQTNKEKLKNHLSRYANEESLYNTTELINTNLKIRV